MIGRDEGVRRGSGDLDWEGVEILAVDGPQKTRIHPYNALGKEPKNWVWKQKWEKIALLRSSFQRFSHLRALYRDAEANKEGSARERLGFFEAPKTKKTIEILISSISRARIGAPRSPRPKTKQPPQLDSRRHRKGVEIPIEGVNTDCCPVCHRGRFKQETIAQVVRQDQNSTFRAFADNYTALSP